MLGYTKNRIKEVFKNKRLDEGTYGLMLWKGHEPCVKASLSIFACSINFEILSWWAFFI